MSDPVIDNAEASRLELAADGLRAELVYRRRPGRLVLVHTEVPEAAAGRGLGGQLVTAALDLAVDQDLTVVPLCPFARAWLQRHPDAAARVRIDWG